MKWDQHYKEIRDANPLVWPDIQVVRLLSKIKLQKDAEVLDLGCGEGRNIRVLSEYEFNITALDQSKHALKIVKRLYQLNDEKLICSNAQLGIKQLDDSHYDLVLCWGLFHYISDTNLLLNEINRILKKGAQTILSFNSFNDKRVTADDVKKYFSQTEIKDALRNNDLRVDEIGLIENNFITDNKVESFYWVLATKV